VALSSTDGAAGPVGIDPLPDGYVLTRTQPPEENLMGDPTVRGWHLTAIRVPQLGQRSTPDYVMVGLDEIVDGDPFLGYPGLADAPDVTIGAFTGKELSIPGYPLFRAVVNDRVLSVGGRASMSDIEAVVEHVRVDGATNSVSVDSFPAGYEVISDGASTYAQGTRAWVVAYGKDHLTANAIAVRAIENPATSALQDLVGPTIAQIVEINGYRGVLSGFGLSLEVSPTFKIEIRREGMLAPDDPGAVSDDLLLEMARNLVAVSVEQFDEWTTATRAAPYTITDGPCTLHVDVQTDLDPTTDDAIDPQTTFTVTVSADQPLADITIGVEGGIPDQPGIGMRLVLASIAELTEPTTVTIAWDGMLDGKPVAPGVYPISLSAEPTASDPTACANNGTLNFASYAVNE